MSNLIGLHIMNNPPRAEIDPILDKLQPATCVCFVTLDNAGYAQSIAQSWRGIKWVVRPWWEDLGKPDNFGEFQASATDSEAGKVNFDLNRAWDNWLNLDGGKMQRFLDTLRGLPNIWIQGHNEVGIGREFVDWEQERAERSWNRLGLKSVVINDGVGKSNFEHFQLFQEMGLYQTLHNCGGGLGYHAYAGGLLELWHGEVQAVSQDGESKPLAKHPKAYLNNVEVYEAARFNDRGNGDLSSWLAFRILRDHHYINETGGGNIPIFITEFGYDDAGRQSLTPYYSNTYTPRGIVQTRKIWDEWGFSNHEEILGKQMAYADAQLRKVPMVQGAAWFQYGEHNSDAWKLFDLQPVDFVPHYIAALKPEPEPTPEPPVAVINAPDTAKAGQEVAFKSESTGQIDRYEWAFGSPDIAGGQVPTAYRTFPAGTYAVVLKVTGPGGSDIATHTITITPAEEPPPEPEPTPTHAFALPNLPDWIPFMVGVITGAAIVLITLALH